MEKNFPVKVVSEKEIWVGENQFQVLSDNIIKVKAVGEETMEKAEIQKEISLKLANSLEGKIKYLIDLNRSGKSSHEARNIWKELSENEKTAKVAMFGMHPVARVIASFVSDITNKKEMRFFKTEEAAIKWLLNK
ncbi:MAG: STAS/SEC14 domain-containing protein [Prolixibacteraceae bacterium]|nr:STAS/SEC14 domain-containing protein [Prolixibacteraceae bacterium]MBN2774601.1 STAS/SEC14 domain-containing protein [Prolixibacteraceae bacterium]